MVSNKKNDCVLVAGGGPVGSLSAYLLARTGIPVTLIEREAGVVLDYRASTIHPPTLDLLEECGAAQMLVDRGLIAPLWQFRDREIGKVAEFDLSLLKNDTRHPYRLQCEQFKLVEWLYGKLRAIPGVETLFEHELTGVALRDDGVQAMVESKDGTKRVCEIGRAHV